MALASPKIPQNPLKTPSDRAIDLLQVLRWDVREQAFRHRYASAYYQKRYYALSLAAMGVTALCSMLGGLGESLQRFYPDLGKDDLHTIIYIGTTLATGIQGVSTFLKYGELLATHTSLACELSKLAAKIATYIRKANVRGLKYADLIEEYEEFVKDLEDARSKQDALMPLWMEEWIKATPEFKNLRRKAHADLADTSSESWSQRNKLAPCEEEEELNTDPKTSNNNMVVVHVDEASCIASSCEDVAIVSGCVEDNITSCKAVEALRTPLLQK